VGDNVVGAGVGDCVVGAGVGDCVVGAGVGDCVVDAIRAFVGAGVAVRTYVSYRFVRVQKLGCAQPDIKKHSDW